MQTNRRTEMVDRWHVSGTHRRQGGFPRLLKQTVPAAPSFMEKFWKRISLGRSGDSSDYYEYTIQLTDGTSYRFTDNLTPPVSQLGRHLEQEVTRRLLPAAIATVDGGAEMVWEEAAAAKGQGEGKGLRVSRSQVSVVWMDGGYDTLALPLVDVVLVSLDEEQLTIL